jgi:D-3-phosphoglycerate dehydrogenase
MIGICRRIFEKQIELKNGFWKKNGGESLSEITVGIIGLGNIGKSLARILSFFGTRTLVNDLLYDEKFCHDLKLVKSTKEEILKNADIISLHIPLTHETHHYISQTEFSLMKKKSWLINTSRGKNVDCHALKYALENKLIAGAALYVFEEEPCHDIKLFLFPNLIVTPHIAGNSKRAVLAMGRSSIEHLVKHFEKKGIS